LFLNEGTGCPAAAGARPARGRGRSGDPAGGRSSLLVCDWNSDGKKDVLFADQDNGLCGVSETRGRRQTAGGRGQPLGMNKYSRPNMGSFVDWDGDGKKDFIGCHFENNVSFLQGTSEAGGSGKGAPRCRSGGP